MTERRTFFGAVAALAAGLFTPSGRPKPKPRQGTVPYVERNAAGDCMARAYRMAADGTYHEVGLLEPKPGDRIIVIGLDGARLWCADAFTVGPGGSTRDPETGDPHADVAPAEQYDLFSWSGDKRTVGEVLSAESVEPSGTPTA